MRGVSRCHPTCRCYQKSHYLLAVVLCSQLSTSPPFADEVTLERSAHGFILVLIGSLLFVDKKGVNVSMCFLPLLRDLTHTATYSWVGAVAVVLHLYRYVITSNVCCCVWMNWPD